MLDKNKVAFIICTNSKLWYIECKKFIDHLEIPYQMQVEVIPVFNAKSMAQGYNKGMNMTNAKYKVYLHHDLFLIEEQFIKKIVQIFQMNKNIGIIGLIGANDIARKRVSWSQWQYGKIIGCTGYTELNMEFGDVIDPYVEVDCVDGMLIATQYDVEWREDIFQKWHFYDRSICMEFRRKGYKSVVPKSDIAWCIHDCGASDLSNWCESLKIFLNEYKDYYNLDWYENSLDLPYTDDKLWKQLHDIEKKMEILFEEQQSDLIWELLNTSLRDYIPLCKQLVFYVKMCDLFKEKNSKIFLRTNTTIKECTETYTKIKFILRRLVYNMPISQEEEQLVNKLTDYELKCIMDVNLNYSLEQMAKTKERKNDDI